MMPETSFTTLVSCDSVYLHDHAPAFAASAAVYDNRSHIHIINPTTGDLDFAYKIRDNMKRITKNELLTITYESTDLSTLSQEERRTYYACNRFLFADNLFDSNSGSLFITDIDSIFMDHINEPNAQLGLFLRESLDNTIGWEQEGTKVAAGAVYYNKSIAWFAKKVANVIRTNELRWFLDQMAINSIYQKHKHEITQFHQFTPQFLDWEFNQGTSIWTGKGPRKFDNPRYISQKNSFGKLVS
jgi:hypothetical protein